MKRLMWTMIQDKWRAASLARRFVYVVVVYVALLLWSVILAAFGFGEIGVLETLFNGLVLVPGIFGIFIGILWVLY